MNHYVKYIALSFLVSVFSFTASEGLCENASNAGLMGVYYGKPDFSNPSGRTILRQTNNDWTHGSRGCSEIWRGYMQAPCTGDVRLTAQADDGAKLEINGKVVINTLDSNEKSSGKISMQEGKKYPVVLSFSQDGGKAFLNLYWSWKNREQSPVEPSALTYSQKDMEHINRELPFEFWDEDKAPIHFDGKGSESLDFYYQHGGLPAVVGVHNYQVYRPNREHPELASGLPYTYNHQVYLAYWKGKFYLEFLAAPVNEEEEPTENFLTVSPDGIDWSKPRLVFPAFDPKGDDEQTVTHHRMGFYVSPENRLLVLTFYGTEDHLHDGEGIGRAVREIYEDGTLSPIYFIRLNRHAGWNEDNTPYPFYKSSPDKGFVKACQSLLSNKLMIQQWWEEGENPDTEIDEFFPVSGSGAFGCEAFNWFTREDGSIVGLWKNAYTALSTDNGQTWTTPQKPPCIILDHAKCWGQRLDNGRYIFVYNPHGEFRYPLAAITSDDGRIFSNMACIHGELPDQRYEGGSKDLGPQYIRGISEGNGNPPGNDLWLGYDVNKEDVWVSRVPVPIRSTVKKWIKETFDKKSGKYIKNWNIYSPYWAIVEVVDYPGESDKSLRLEDSEPYDYARAVRVFPQSKQITVEFEILAGQSGNGRMEIEVASRTGKRPVRLTLTEKGRIKAADGKRVVDLQKYEPEKWLSFTVNVNITKSTYNLAINEKQILKNAGFAEKVDSVQRLSFRTGKYRRLGTRRIEDTTGEVLPNAGDPQKKSVYYLNNVSVSPGK